MRAHKPRAPGTRQLWASVPREGMHAAALVCGAAAARTLDEEVPHRSVPHTAHEAHALAEAARMDHGLEVGALWAIAADEEAQARVPPAELWDGCHLQVHALAVHEPAEHHHPACTPSMHSAAGSSASASVKGRPCGAGWPRRQAGRHRGGARPGGRRRGLQGGRQGGGART